MDEDEVLVNGYKIKVPIMRYVVILSSATLCFFYFFSLAHTSDAPAVQGAGPGVAVLSISGPVEGAMAAYVDRAVHQAEKTGQHVLVRIDTNGGRLDAALKIVDTLLRLPPEKTMAFVDTKAISAGALIALSCGALVLHPDATIGDCAPISFSGEGPKMLGEKFQSPLRAKFRSLARRNGYPPLLAEAMVTPGLEIWRVHKDETVRYLSADDVERISETAKKNATKVVAKGQLLTMDAVEAKDLGFAMATALSVEEAAKEVFSTPTSFATIDPTWSERMSRFLHTVTPFLILLGAAGLYLEMKTPGFGVFGVTGVLFLSLVFFNQYLVGLATYLEFFLAILGVMLLLMEFFVLPGFGVAGIAGILSIIVALVLSLQDFVVPDPSLPWQGAIISKNVFRVLSAFAGAFFLSLCAIRYLVPRIGQVIDGPFLHTTLADSHASSDKDKTISKGSVGIAVTDLRPAGRIRIGENDLDAVTEGDYAKKGARITVTAIRSGHVVVNQESV